MACWAEVIERFKQLTPEEREECVRRIEEHQAKQGSAYWHSPILIDEEEDDGDL